MKFSYASNQKATVLFEQRRKKKMEYKEKMEEVIENAIDNDCLFYYDMIEVALVMINQASIELKREIEKEVSKDDGFHNCKLDILFNKLDACDKCYNILDTY